MTSSSHAQLNTVAIGFAKVAAYVALFVAVVLVSQIGTEALIGYLPYWLHPVLQGLAAIFGVVGLTYLFRRFIDKLPWIGVGLPKVQITNILLGFILGAAAILVAFAIECLLGWASVARIALEPHRGLPKVWFLALVLIPSIGVGVSEELAFRGYVFQTFAERMPVWLSALVTGLVFSFLHFNLPGFGPGFVLSVLMMMFMFVALKLVSGSLWFPIGFHAAWDWTQTYLTGLSVAGDKHDPSLVQIIQRGPPTWVGGPPSIEGGYLFIIAIAAISAASISYAHLRGAPPPWTKRLTTDGRTPVDSSA